MPERDRIIQEARAQRQRDRDRIGKLIDEWARTDPDGYRAVHAQVRQGGPMRWHLGYTHGDGYYGRCTPSDIELEAQEIIGHRLPSVAGPEWCHRQMITALRKAGRVVEPQLRR